MRNIAIGLFVSLLYVSHSQASDVVSIIQKDRAFSAADISVHVGDTVRFLNHDDFSHNVYSQTPGSEFDLKIQKPGETKELTLTRPGTVDIECDIHPKMHMTIQVK